MRLALTIAAFAVSVPLIALLLLTVAIGKMPLDVRVGTSVLIFALALNLLAVQFGKPFGRRKADPQETLNAFD